MNIAGLGMLLHEEVRQVYEVQVRECWASGLCALAHCVKSAYSAILAVEAYAFQFQT